MFDFDVFLSHNSKDKPAVRLLAQRLRGDGLRVFLDEDDIQFGDSIPLMVERALEKSRVLIMVMTDDFFASKWATLERHTFLFRDATNEDRRFIPLLLRDCKIPEAIKQFKYADWRTPNDEVYRALIRICRRSSLDNRDEITNDNNALGKVQDTNHRNKNAESNNGISKGIEALRGVWDNAIASWYIDSPKQHTTSIKGNIPTDNMLLQRDIIDLQQDDTIMQGHNASIQSVVFSPDGKILASASADKTLRLWNVESKECLAILEGHVALVWSVAFSPDGKILASASYDRTLRLWNVESKECLAILKGHTSLVRAVVFSPDGKTLASASADKTLRLWDVETKKCLAILEGHTNIARSVAFSPDGKTLASASYDKTLRLWNVESKKCLAILKGHTDLVPSVVFSPDGMLLASGSADKTLRLWNVETKRCLAILKGHTDSAPTVAFSPDGRFLTSGSDDLTVRLWDVETKKCLATLEGHTNHVRSVAFSPDGKFLASASSDNTLRLWDLIPFGIVKGNAVVSNIPAYMNARVLIIGDSGVGKSGLAHRLTRDNYKETDSTDGAWATIVPLPGSAEKDADENVGVQREVWLWDFAGQQDYRLLHQLFMDEAALVVFVFNPQTDNPFEGLGRWDEDIKKAAGGDYTKLLVAGRVDRGGVVVSAKQIDKFVAERGFKDYIETSAKTGKGCDTLRDAVRRHINWENIPRTVSPQIFRRLKEEILSLRDSGIVLLRREELRQRLEFAMGGDAFTEGQFDTVVGLLSGPGIVWKLDFGGFVLLRPEEISGYAGAVVRAVRAHPDETGCIAEEDFIAGNLDYQDRTRLPRHDEEIVLRALLQTLLKRGICFRQPTEHGSMLIFPSLFRVERPTLTIHPPHFVTYRFAGMLDDVYATLVVRLHHTKLLEKDALWRNAADFKTLTGQRVGIKVERKYEGNCELTVYCDPAIVIETRTAFMLYIDQHIRAHATEVTRSRHYVCPNCRTPAENHAAIAILMERGDTEMPCIVCRKEIPLHDEIERRFGQVAAQRAVAKMNQEADTVLKTQSKEQSLLGEITAIAQNAGQQFYQTLDADYGIDGEIEFKTANGEATGKRIYLQLEPGSYLRTMIVAEDKLTTLLEGLVPADLTRVISRMEHVSEHVPENIPHYERVAKILGYVRSTVGPDMTDLCKTVDALFPTKTQQWLRSRRSTDGGTATVEVIDLPEKEHTDQWLASDWEVYLLVGAANRRVRWMNVTEYLKRQTTPRRQLLFDGNEFNSYELVLLRDQIVKQG